MDQVRVKLSMNSLFVSIMRHQLVLFADCLEDREDIDCDRIGIWGVSLGGYYAPRAAAFEERIKACISLTGPFDFAEAFDRAPELTRQAFIARSHSKTASMAKKLAVKMNLSSVASEITCPLYIVGGALDRVIPPDHAQKVSKVCIRRCHFKHG
jgi:2,6-dihydroxypseudooxynicotine hydrolase